MRPHLRTPQRPSRAGQEPARRRWQVPAVLLVTIAAILSACTPAAAGPETVLQDFVEAYNADDVDGVRQLFAEDALLTGHPFGPHAEGVDTIMNVHAADRVAAARREPYEISNVEVDGDTVTWDHAWTNRDGEIYCADGNRFVIEDGQITTWEFAPNPHECP